MGIRGLKTFISRNCPETVQPESIEILAELHREKNATNGKVKIVADGPPCAFEIYGNEDMYCGGQFGEFKTRVQQFVDAFKNLGISLVFFFIGTIPDDRLEKWMAKKMKEEGYIQEMMDEIKSGVRKGAKRVEWAKVFFYLTIKALYKNDEFVEIYTAPKGKRTNAIAQYAIDNDCLAILSDDTCFFVFDTVPIISCKDLNLKEMTTSVVNHKSICEKLQCTQNVMQISAAIKYDNCDGFSVFYNRRFHKNYRYQGPLKYNPNFGSVLRYVKSFGNVNDDDILDVIAHDLRTYGSEEAANNFRESFMFFNLGQQSTAVYSKMTDGTPEFTNHDSVVQYFNNKVVTADIFPTIVEAITNGKIIIRTTPIADFSDQTLVSHIELFRPVRQKLYGLIFNSQEIEKRDICEIWPSMDISIANENVEPISTPFSENESLTTLWMNNTSSLSENENIKVNCLLKCYEIVSGNILQNVSKQFQPIAVILQYMFKHPNVSLEDWEVDAFIGQALLSNSDSSIWNQFESLEPRACHLAALFVQGVLLYLDVTMCCCLDLEQAMPWNYFNGLKFQYCYQQIKKGATARQLICSTDDNVSEQLLNQLLAFIRD